MATTYAYESAYPPSPIYAMGGHASHCPDDTQNDTMAPQISPRDAPPPNPPFSFPARIDSPSSAPASLSRTTRRRPMSAIETPTQSYQLAVSQADEKPTGRSPLPNFSFNPGASLPPNLDSPAFNSFSLPVSPQSPRTLPSGVRPAGHGHKRGGSEFVGGQIRKGNSIAVISGSPTKLESGLGPLNLAPPRRGHRRGLSSAMSTDFALLPPPQHNFAIKGSSAPNTPTHFHHTRTMSVPANEMMHNTEATSSEVKGPNSVEPGPKEGVKSLDESAEPKPISRVRVGFSDTVEFIPRPLSLVSTDTSSTITARPGHAISGSISSIMSTAAYNGRESPVPTCRSPTRDMDDSRPSTAGAILEHRFPAGADGLNICPKRRNSIPALLDLAEATHVDPSTPSPSKSAKRWSFFGLESFANHGSPTKARPHSSSSGDSVARAVSGCSSSDHGSESLTEAEPKAPKHNDIKAKRDKRRKKVKGWAGSILPRKGKSHGDKRQKYDVRPPTPPASVVPPEDLEEDDMDLDSPVPQPPPIVTIETSTPPRPSHIEKHKDEVSSPMIDLDAALGPFNTPLPHNPEWEAAQQAAGNAGKRRLHSAQGMRGFSGPGMHYHRRAESAPDLPPFDPGRNSIHRFGSSSTMADVFEEDEEEVQGEDSTESKVESHDYDGDVTPPAVTSKDSIKELAPRMRRKSSGLSDKDHTSAASIRAQRSRTSLHENVIAEEPSTLRFRTSNIFQSPPTLSPGFSPRRVSGGRDVPPFELGAPHAPYSGNMPLSPHSTSYTSGYPSPRSPMSADTQLLSTAPSSVHEENSFQSLLLGEPGPEVRLSVDYDIPSLTSSNSTMTRESSYFPHARMSQPTLRQPRPLSVSSAAFGRRRSSLVSLSRLISSSHGERSKLSMEVTLDNEGKEKKAKSGKSSRLGKLMQFWKPNKDDAPSSH